jgi:hypothetical protein
VGILTAANFCNTPGRLPKLPNESGRSGKQLSLYLRKIQKSAAANGARLTLLELKTKMLNFVLAKAKQVLTQKFLTLGKLAKLQIKKIPKIRPKTTDHPPAGLRQHSPY